MLTVHRIPALRQQVREWHAKGLGVAFVPTMGNLHEGHLQLVDAARALAERVVVSIFVNPLQFGPNEDLEAYPRTPEADARRLAERGAHLLYLPAVEDIYPRPLAQMTRISVPGLSERWCGQYRPGHFEGVATVVCKLLNQVQPDVAVFGEKDFQQLQVIRRMVADLDMQVNIHGVPTVREADGLAMSSRNQYLDAGQRAIAPRLQATLQALARRLGEQTTWRALEAEAMKNLEKSGFRPEYVAICRENDLEPANPGDAPLVILAAAWLGRARLIDNIRVPEVATA